MSARLRERRGGRVRGFFSVIGVQIACMPVGFAGASIIWNQQPTAGVALFSDTQVGTSPDRIKADDFWFETQQSARAVTWWGGHCSNLQPASETIRVRFYAAQPTISQLPGLVIYEQLFGGIVGTPTTVFSDPSTQCGNDAIQNYEYTAILSQPVTFSGNFAKYWLEVSQVGDADSGFVRAPSPGAIPGFASLSINNYWIYVNQPDYPGISFVLDTAPEPHVVLLLLAGIAIVCGRKRTRRFRAR